MFMEVGAAPAVMDQLDLEAAEQLIQLSGGDDGGSESRSADSVKCRRAAAGREDKYKEAAVESRRRSTGRFPAGDSGESGSKSADSSTSSKAAGREEKDKEAAVESCRRSAGRFLAAGKDGDGGEAGKSGSTSADSLKFPRAAGMEQKDKEVAVQSRGRSTQWFPAGNDGAADCNGVVYDGEARKRTRFRSLADIYREMKNKRVADEEGESPRKKKRAGDEMIPPKASKEIRDLEQVVDHTRV